MSGIEEKPVVVFEGGLGSQLLPLIEALQLRHYGIPFDVNSSYFFPKVKPQHMVQRPWRLDRYGYALENIDQIGDFKPRKFRLSKKSKLTTWEYAREFASVEIPLLISNLDDFLLQYGFNHASDFSVVHLRRGDYLAVSSRVISDNEVAIILTKVQKMLDHKVFIISDSKISLKSDPQFRELTTQNGLEFIFIQGTDIDEMILHDLMRTANFLVCSNSTFSFSAALLSKQGARAIAPIDFFDPESMAEVNKKFRSAGNFFLLN